MSRRIFFGPDVDPLLRPTFSHNNITSSRYTLWNFLPLTLFIQIVYYPVNLWFVIITILQLPPRISVTQGYPTMLVPLSFVIVVAIIKDGLEDYRRHQNDKLENNRTCQQWSRRDNKIIPTAWKNIKVGDILTITSSEFVPADMVIIGANGAGVSGRCYVETSNLDGETNHKTKQAPALCTSMFTESTPEALVQRIDKLDGVLEFELPTAALYSFAGILHVGEDHNIPFDTKNVLLRGAKLMNSKWIVGIVVYTGDETKIRMNLTQKVKKKMTRVESIVLRVLVGVFMMQIFLSCVGAGFNTLYVSSEGTKATYLYLLEPNPTYQNLLKLPAMETFGIRFLTFVLIFSNFVPISLIVTMHMVKFGQAIFMHMDNSMRCNDFRATPRTSDLNEDLGQVEYVLTDKTGTLTQNKMEFRKCFIDGFGYGHGTAKLDQDAARHRKRVAPGPDISQWTNSMSEIMPTSEMGEMSTRLPKRRVTPCVQFDDPTLLCELKKGVDHIKIYNFFLHLAINHVAYPVEDSERTMFSAAPEEKALVYFAAHFDFKLCERTSSTIVVEVPPSGEKLEVTILAMFEFSSMRRRSSTVVRYVHPLTHEEMVVVYTKGSDVVIEERVVSTEEQITIREVSRKYAQAGFRTLVFAHRVFSPEEYEEWWSAYCAATESVNGREAKITQATELAETNLELDGISAIEDKLQEHVCETIKLIKEAGIKIWMLTGDKAETAISVAVAASLLDAESHGSDQVIFDWTAFERASNIPTEEINDKGEIISDAQDLQRGSPTRSYKNSGRKSSKQQRQNAARERCMMLFDSCLSRVHTHGNCKALVVDGASFTCFMERPNDFLFLCCRCSFVICYRISPDQKGQVVRLIKERQGAITLAIGDGANDCNMIMSANIGVGIRGEEGLQAFNSCDYGIGNFSCLRSLLFVHGRSSYRRISFVVMYIFYKNIVVVIPQYLLGAWSQFSGMRLYPDLLYQLYNVFFTGLPIWIYGMMDKDIPNNEGTNFPRLYMLGPANSYLNLRNLISYSVAGFWHAALAFSMSYFVLAGAGVIVMPEGKNADIWCVGNVTLLLEIIIVNGKLIFDSYTLNWVSWVGFALCFGSYIVLCLMITLMPAMFGGGWEAYGVYLMIFSAPVSYVVICVTLNVAFGVQLAGIILRNLLAPTPVQMARTQISQRR